MNRRELCFSMATCRASRLARDVPSQLVRRVACYCLFELGFGVYPSTDSEECLEVQTLNCLDFRHLAQSRSSGLNGPA